ncbi:unnamed protein product [Periconia digitata]|uniref:Uncharacterized protein n=1 Tax=Periconia digitata TaxID=1303443 RepID=A0A9W4XDA5_9PLEO|nr:unnamed protein product [Periconia digitata]
MFPSSYLKSSIFQKYYRKTTTTYLSIYGIDKEFCCNIAGSPLVANTQAMVKELCHIIPNTRREANCFVDDILTGRTSPLWYELKPI